MAADPKKIAKRLREQVDLQEKESESCAEQLALTDALIDEYDEIINKLDNKLPPLIDTLNDAITAVQRAYIDRIDHGCRSGLRWVQLENQTYNRKNSGSFNVQVYEVQKDPDTYTWIGYYGAKYYKYPKNMDYGANVVETISNADVNIDSAALVIFDSDADYLTGFATGRNPGIRTGDLITDALINPTLFPSGNATATVGFGITPYPAQTYPLSGFCTSGDNKIYADNKIGIFTAFSIGDFVYGDPNKSGGGMVAAGTTITGITTAVGIQSYVDNTGITSAVETVLNVFELSNAVSVTVNKDIGTSFYIGIVSDYYFAHLSQPPATAGINSSFLVVRPGNTDDLVFESTKNPIDPIEIGIAQNVNIGKGHKLDLINNGDPNITAQWREVRQEPEPKVGNNRAEYYVGTFNWPTYTVTNNIGQNRGPAQVFYATEGQRITIGIGGTNAGATTIGYLNVPPSGSIPSDCGTYDAAIAAREAELNELRNINIPKINHYINGAKAMRSLRNEDETRAWGYLQAIGYVNSKKKQQQADASSIEDFNWADLGYEL